MWAIFVIFFKLWLNFCVVKCVLDADYELLSSAESGDMVLIFCSNFTFAFVNLRGKVSVFRKL